MASGRVGGTRSKIRGQVGDIIYQVVKNPDGTYTQIEYGKPDTVLQSISPRGQAQRMCMCMVEALMRDLGEVGKISMQAAPNKSKSLNAFSSFNVQLLAQDCKAHWYGGNQFRYPTTASYGDPDQELGGYWMLSSGTWQYDGFDECVHIANPWAIWPYARFLRKRFCGIRFQLAYGNETVDHFLRRHYLSRLDTMVFACMHQWMDTETDPDDPQLTSKHSYIFVNLNPSISDSEIISPTVLESLFITSSDWEVFRSVSDDGRNYYIGLLIDNENDDGYFWTKGAFTISYMEGKKKISNSRMQLIEDMAGMYFENHAPADVFGTWMGTPNVRPYPTPFI